MQAKVVEAAEWHFSISHVTWEYIKMMLVNFLATRSISTFGRRCFTSCSHRDKPAFSMKPAKRFVLVL